MSAQTIANAINWGVVICLGLWIALWLLERAHEARQRRKHERRTTRERYWV